MERRDFLTTSLAASAVAFAGSSEAQTPPAANGREYYELRKYHLQSGPQTKLTETYVSTALIPALNRLGIAPVGAFHLDIGPETPTLYLLLPCANVETLVMAELRLADDAEFMKAAAPFWNAPATAPAFQRVESSLHVAFAGYPKLTLPAPTPSHGTRIFQLRIYESPSYEAHVRKVEMFHHGEFEIFKNAGCGALLYSDTLIGQRMPNLMYMLSFTNLTELTARWKAFVTDPEWIKLKNSPRYAYEEIVSNITSLVLSPTSYSQI